MNNVIDYKSILASNIRDLLYRNNKTQSQLCRDLDISRSTLSEWIAGNVFPRIDKIDILARYFNVSTAYLIENDEMRYGLPSDVLEIANAIYTNPKLYLLMKTTSKLQGNEINALTEMAKMIYNND